MGTQRCGRRDDMFAFNRDDGENPDEWRTTMRVYKSSDITDDKEGEDVTVPWRYCSYCGSMNPDDFLTCVERGYEVGPTDKSYKAYLKTPAGEGSMSWNAQGAKFYFQHFDEAQKHRFIDMLNAKVVKFGYPGYFYTKPFFIAYGPPAATS